MKVAWGTDVHFDFIQTEDVRRYCERISQHDVDAVLLGGDIAMADDVTDWVRFVASEVRRPVYFVLGNHDYYAGRIAAVRGRMLGDLGGAHWLPAAGAVRLTANTVLVGHDGWGDGRHGTFLESGVDLSDYYLIGDLQDAYTDKSSLQKKLQELGDDAAGTFRPMFEQALRSSPEVLVLTHVPPFREACWHEGSLSTDEWLGGFTCKAMGDVLFELARAHPERQVKVLCGHTHSPGTAEILPNLRVHTGRAVYGAPEFEILEVS
ncbi:MAG TPA: metallophosphoesterase [Candidatus Krumholzibacteria bacterium]|nr:metallophosphoesterase [Candidatus Krumholzibacteria bacterium]